MPVACALKDRFPDVYIGWLAESGPAELLRGHQALDSVIEVPPRRRAPVLSMLALTRRLRRHRFDVALDLQGIRSSTAATLLSGAPRRLGFVGTIAHEFRSVLRSAATQIALSRRIAGLIGLELVQAGAEHMVDRYLEILRPLGIEKPGVRFGVPGSESDTEAAERVRDCLPGSVRGYAIVHPGGRPWKRWPEDRFAAVVAHLGQTHGLATVVVHGDRSEQRLAEAIAANSGGFAIAAPRLRILALAALSRGCRVFVAGDTGPLHLAAAVGAPCVGLYGITPSSRFAPYGPRNLSVQGYARAEFPVRHQDKGRSAMMEIDIESVCRACNELLAR